MDKKSLRIGITGSRGVLGRSLIKYWSMIDSKIEFDTFNGDIQNIDEIDQWINNENRFHAIIHLAALVPTIEVDKNPLKAFRINSLGTLNLLETCRLKYSENECPWIFYSSTSHIYSSDEHQHQNIKESSLINPISTYGLTKYQADQWAELYRTKYRLPICTGRIFSYSSPNQASNFFIPSLIEKIRNAPLNARLEIRGLDGTRDFLTVQQIVETIEYLFSKKSIGVFNIGTGQATKLLDLAHAVQNRLDRTDLIIVSTGTDTNHLVANIEKLIEIGFRPIFNLDQLLDSFFSCDMNL